MTTHDRDPQPESRRASVLSAAVRLVRSGDAGTKRESSPFDLDPRRFDAPWPGVTTPADEVGPITPATVTAPAGKPTEAARGGEGFDRPVGPSDPNSKARPFIRRSTTPDSVPAAPEPLRALAEDVTGARIEQVLRDAEAYLSKVECEVHALRSEADAFCQRARREGDAALAAAKTSSADLLAEAKAERDSILAGARLQASAIVAEAERRADDNDLESAARRAYTQLQIATAALADVVDLAEIDIEHRLRRATRAGKHQWALHTDAATLGRAEHPAGGSRTPRSSADLIDGPWTRSSPEREIS